MSDFYGAQHRAFQDDFGVRPLADRVRDAIVHPELTDVQHGFIESRDFFFLTTIDHRGFPTVSHKGGSPGFVRVVDGRTLAFPSYDGNAMYLSMGNISANPKIGMLFIDFETPHRVRVHGTATVRRDDPLLASFAGAELVVRVGIEEAFINCPRYIHRYERVATSRYVPQPDGAAPGAQWKRIDAIQDALPERDRDLAQSLGGTLTMEEYGELLRRGEA